MTDKTISRTETVESVPLLPCPFCGGEARYHIHDRFGIECIECGAGYAAVFPTKADVRRAWNARAERTCHIVEASRKYVLSDGTELYEDGCSECNGYLGDGDNYCPNCGAKVVDA